MTEQDLRDVLQRKASSLHGLPDLDGIERRGRRMRRNRRIVTAAGPLAAVVAIAIAVPVLSSGGSAAPSHRPVPAVSTPSPRVELVTTPSNVETWPMRGVEDAALLAFGKTFFAHSVSHDGQVPQVKVLYGGSTGKSQFLLAQMWFPTDTKATSVAVIRHSDVGDPEVQLNADLTSDAKLAAFVVTEAGGDLVVVVPAPGVGLSGYAQDGTHFAPNPAQPDGAVFLERGLEVPKDPHDQVRITGAFGTETDQVQSFLCGLTSCG